MDNLETQPLATQDAEVVASGLIFQETKLKIANQKPLVPLSDLDQ